MNNCVIELRGEVKNIIKFMVENINFVHADNNGVNFTTEINFGKIVRELDEDAMKELYGVPVNIPVRYTSPGPLPMAWEYSQRNTGILMSSHRA